MRHAVAMETEVHARNWSFVIGPSRTVITNLSREATSATTGLMLFTIKRANAMQTFLDMSGEIKCEFGYYGKDCAPKKSPDSWTVNKPIIFHNKDVWLNEQETWFGTDHWEGKGRKSKKRGIYNDISNQRREGTPVWNFWPATLWQRVKLQF